MGLLKYRCLKIDSGYYDDLGIVCGAYECPQGYSCAHVLDNPNYGVTNFDNILISLVTIFQIITLEGWTSVMVYTQTSFSYYSVFFYIPLIFIAANLILNFTLLRLLRFRSKKCPASFRLARQLRMKKLPDSVFEAVYRNTSSAYLEFVKKSEPEIAEQNSEICMDDAQRSKQSLGIEEDLSEPSGSDLEIP